MATLNIEIGRTVGRESFPAMAHVRVSVVGKGSPTYEWRGQ
jgi:hypothetical protein